MKRTFAFQVRCLPLLGLCAGVLLAGTVGCAGDLDPSLLQSNTGTAGTSGGGGTSGTAGTGGGTTACDVFTMLFAMSMTCGACHYPSSPLGGGFDLASPGVASRLVGMGPSKDSTAMCQSSGKVYLDANSNPATGLLIDKITLSMGDPKLCGSPMPIGPTLTAAQKKCITDWATAVTTGAIK